MKRALVEIARRPATWVAVFLIFYLLYGRRHSALGEVEGARS